MEPSLILSEHDAAKELSKLPAKKRLLQQQQFELNNSNPVVAPSSISIIPLTNQAHSTTSNSISSSNNNNNNSFKDRPESDEPMEEDEEINVHDDDSPLDMRITKHDSDSDIRPSVIRRAPSFKETNSNSPSDPSSTCDPFIDEHFRRSLGTDYDLILRKKQMEQEQRLLEEQKQQLLIQQQQQAAAVALKAQHQNILKHHKKHQIHQHHQAMLNIQQQENQLPIQTTTIPIQVPIVPAQTQLPIPHPHQSPALPNQPQKQVIITQHADASESMSVDDHFAKALGETWTKIQNENK